MPKSTKKKREKAADFTKTKLRLGKKQTPANVVDTSFKARPIALPTQSITAEKGDDIPTTKRRLTIDDLLVHLRHYSPTTRKDAILGLRELLEDHWGLVQTHLVTLLNGLMRLINDEDASVRKVLASLLAWLLPRLSPEELIPHSSLLLLYTTSAQTHIFPEIRVDAIRVLNVLLDCIPGTVTAGWCQESGDYGNRVLDGYLGILNVGRTFKSSDGPVPATSTEIVVLSPASKLVVLQSLFSFLRAGLSSLQLSGQDGVETSPFWCLARAFKSAEAFIAFDSLLHPTIQAQHSEGSNTRIWTAKASPEDDDFVLPPGALDAPHTRFWSLAELLHESTGPDQAPDSEAMDAFDFDYLARLTRNLQSTLVSTFLDSVPTVFSPSGPPSETSLNIVLAVSQITKTLHSTLLQRSDLAPARHGDTIDDLGSLLGHMAPYFPFLWGNRAGIKAEQAFQELNVIFCELVALYQFAMDSQLLHKRRSKSGAASDKWVTLVSTHIVRLLKEEPLSSAQLARPLTPVAYLSLIPAIWYLLDSQAPSCVEQRHDVLNAVIDHGMKSAKSAAKRASVEFISRLALLDTDAKYQGELRISERDKEINKKFGEWVLHLPQCLWEAGTKNLLMTEVILRVLLRLLQRTPRIVHAEAARILVSKFVPYFSFKHPTRGQLLGPYTKLPLSSSLRRLTLDVAVTLMETLHRDLDSRDLRSAIDLAVAGTHEQGYWTHILHKRCEGNDISI